MPCPRKSCKLPSCVVIFGSITVNLSSIFPFHSCYFLLPIIIITGNKPFSKGILGTGKPVFPTAYISLIITSKRYITHSLIKNDAIAQTGIRIAYCTAFNHPGDGRLSPHPTCQQVIFPLARNAVIPWQTLTRCAESGTFTPMVSPWIELMPCWISLNFPRMNQPPWQTFLIFPGKSNPFTLWSLNCARYYGTNQTESRPWKNGLIPPGINASEKNRPPKCHK